MTVTQAHRQHVTVNSDGTVTLSGLPFPPGSTVEIIVLGEETAGSTAETTDPYPFRGIPLHYERPTDPVDDEAWDADK